jgi:cell division protein FtsW (lipid II flippase)
VGRKVAVVLYVAAMAAVIVSVDVMFLRNRFWERLAVNIGIVSLTLAFGAGGGYYGHTRWGPRRGAAMGLGTVLLILLIAYLLGFVR